MIAGQTSLYLSSTRLVVPPEDKITIKIGVTTPYANSINDAHVFRGQVHRAIIVAVCNLGSPLDMLVVDGLVGASQQHTLGRACTIVLISALNVCPCSVCSAAVCYSPLSHDQAYRPRIGSLPGGSSSVRRYGRRAWAQKSEKTDEEARRRGRRHAQCCCFGSIRPGAGTISSRNGCRGDEWPTYPRRRQRGDTRFYPRRTSPPRDHSTAQEKRRCSRRGPSAISPGTFEWDKERCRGSWAHESGDLGRGKDGRDM